MQIMEEEVMEIVEEGEEEEREKWKVWENLAEGEEGAALLVS